MDGTGTAGSTAAEQSGSPGTGCPVSGGLANLADPVLHAVGDVRAVWTRLRRQEGLAWTPVEGAGGFWSATRYADVEQVLRDAETFTSERGTVLGLLGTEDPAGGRQIAATDPPRHTAMRAKLQRALAAPRVEHQRASIAALVSQAFAPLADGGPFDLAQAMLAVPVAVGARSMGLPRADWPRLGFLLTSCIAPDDPEFRAGPTAQASLARAHRELFAYFQDVHAERRRRPGDDLVSLLMSVEVDGRPMSPGEVMSNCYSLLLGAAATTPHVPSHVLAEHLDDGTLRRWAADPGSPAALDEALRLASPASHFMRYAVVDTEVAGTRVAAGEAVVSWIGAANRDPQAFTNPDVFDVHRRAGRHLAFGVGPHYCVGHGLARLTLGVVFEHLLSRFTDFAPAGDPVRLHSNLITGWKHLPITARTGHRPVA